MPRTTFPNTHPPTEQFVANHRNKLIFRKQVIFLRGKCRICVGVTTIIKIQHHSNTKFNTNSNYAVCALILNEIENELCLNIDRDFE